MPDLTSEEVRVLLAASGLSTADREELEEITHRINALHDALSALDLEDLSEEPLTVFPTSDS